MTTDKNTTEAPVETAPADYRVLFPGRDVVALEDKDGAPLCRVTVYPLGVAHLSAFSDEIARMLAVVSSVKLTGDKKEIGQRVAVALAPQVLRHMLGLLQECVVVHPMNAEGGDVAVEFSQLPHWALPEVVEAWIDESFGEEKKWRPWMTVLDRIVEKTTGGEFSSISEILSSSSQPGDTQPTTS